MQAISSIGKLFGGGGYFDGGNSYPMGTPPFVGGSSGSAPSMSSPWMKALGLGSLGAGFVGNWLQQRRYNNIYDAYTRMLSNYQNPQWLSAQVANLEKPISTALKQNVGNGVQAMMAERGLSQAPGMFESALAQALAPYDLQNRQMALNAAMAPMQLNPMYALASGRPQGTDLSGLMQGVYKIFHGGSSQSPMTITGDSYGYDPWGSRAPTTTFPNIPWNPNPLGGQ
jgi:hypothetical protein